LCGGSGEGDLLLLGLCGFLRGHKLVCTLHCLDDDLACPTPFILTSTRLLKPAQTSRRSGGQQISELSRGRIIAAMAAVVSEHGVEGATVARVIAHARASRATFYKLFDDRDDCLLATIEQAVALARARARGPWDSEQDWLGRVRGALHALLEFFEDEPVLARLCIVHSSVQEPAIMARRLELLSELASIIDGGRDGARNSPGPLTAEAVVNGSLGVIHRRLVEPQSGKLVDVANPLMSFIARPYRGASAARRELHRSTPPSPRAGEHEKALGRRPRSAPRPLPHGAGRITYRTARAISAIAAAPGLSNAEVSKRADVSDQGQISKLLNRLARAGLAKNTGEGQPRGGPNAWHLTAAGERLARSLDHELSSWQ
jgi:AcrR family transcriptional regulator